MGPADRACGSTSLAGAEILTNALTAIYVQLLLLIRKGKAKEKEKKERKERTAKAKDAGYQRPGRSHQEKQSQQLIWVLGRAGPRAQRCMVCQSSAAGPACSYGLLKDAQRVKSANIVTFVFQSRRRCHLRHRGDHL